MMDDAGLTLLRSIEAMVRDLVEKVSHNNDATDELARRRRRAATRQAKYREEKSHNNDATVSHNGDVTEGTIGEISCSSSTPEKQEEETTPQPPVTSQNVTVVWEHWCSTWNKSGWKFTKDRKRKIQARLGEGYAVELLCEAISGSTLDPWEGRREQCDLVHLLKPANIEKFADLWKKRQMNGNSPLWKRQGFTSPEEYAAHLETVPDG